MPMLDRYSGSYIPPSSRTPFVRRSSSGCTHSEFALDSGTRLIRKFGTSILLGILALALPLSTAEASGKNYDTFAKCLSDKKALMYGAFWCENCAKQKDLFGSSFKNVTYRECAVMGAPRQQTDECKYLQIRKYPTWIFSDNERRQGVQSLESLADKTGCKLP